MEKSKFRMGARMCPTERKRMTGAREFEQYRRLISLREYLLINQRAPHVELFVRLGLPRPIGLSESAVHGGNGRHRPG